MHLCISIVTVIAAVEMMMVLFVGVFVLVGIIAGATGACVGTPAEISLIRMTSDGR